MLGNHFGHCRSWPGANGICKTKDNSKGLGQTAICHLLFVWGKSMNRERKRKRQEKLGDRKKVGKCSCEHTAP